MAITLVIIALMLFMCTVVSRIASIHQSVWRSISGLSLSIVRDEMKELEYTHHEDVALKHLID